MKISEVMVVVTYAVLCVIWLIIAWEVWSTVRRLRTPLGLEQTRRRLLTAGLVVSLALALDFGYWMIDTAGRWGIVPGKPNLTLEDPVWNMIEKIPLVVAGAAFLWTFTMISRLTSAEIDKRYFSRFAERTLDAITLLDPNGHIQYWNKQAERMFGWDRDQVVGRHIIEVMVPEDRKEEVEGILNRVRSEKKALSLERTERLTASHNIITVSIDTAPILDPDFIGYFSIIRPAAQRNPFADHPYFREKGLPARVPGKVFVAMPFSIHEGGFNVWDQLLIPVEKDLKLKLVRADRQLAAHGVVDQVFHDIASSDLVIADLTGNNPNVYYEIGLTHALGIEALLLLRANESIPFNVRHLQIISCDPTNLSQAREDIRRAIVSKRGL
jgi:PAS domain S-box-containing protein